MSRTEKMIIMLGKYLAKQGKLSYIDWDNTREYKDKLFVFNKDKQLYINLD